MKPRSRAWLLCVLFLLAAPARSQAGVIDWIDHLSGPGPYWGVTLEWRMVCLTEPEENTDEDKVRITGFGLVSPVYLKPIVVDVKPLSVIHGTSSRYKYGNWDEFIALRAGLMVFPESFDSADFGALPGFKSSRDILFTWGVVLDLDPLFPKRANPPAPSVPGTPGAKP